MSKPNYTPNQQKALTAQGNAAVSASAGSGKTTVMIAKILRDLETTDIENILILTYNNSIAAEMRAKIISALFEAVKNADGEAKRSRYAAQIDKIQFADISTIHGFCNRLVKSNFEVLGIDPAYDVAEDDDVSQKALKEVLDEYYSSDDEVFQKITEYLLAKPTDDYLEKVILKIYRQLEIQPNPEKALSRLKEIHSEASAAPAEKVVLNYYKNLFLDLASLLSETGKRASAFATNDADQKYVDAVKSVFVKAKSLAEAKSLSELSSLAESVAGGLSNMPSKYSGPSEIKEAAKAFKKAVQEAAKEITPQQFKDKYNYTPGDEKIFDNGSLIKLKLLEITEKYAERFSELKLRAGKLDYGDLEHYAIKLLSDENRLKAITDKYKLVFVDEYQDVNAAQEYIIDKVSSKARVFTVGDVKQSIYGFRSANPEIFSERLARYGEGNGGEAVFFNDNFRCNYEILDFVNRIFDKAMTEKTGGVDYENTARFVTETAAGEKLRAGGTVKVTLFEKPKAQKEEWDGKGVFSIENYVQPDTVDVSAAKAEAEEICNNIKTLVGKRIEGDPNGKICDYGDISVLVRSRAAGREILARIKELGYPVRAAKFEDDDSTAERDELINFIRVLDNKKQDIPLAGFLLGFFGGFTKSELADVKLFGKSQSFSENIELAKNSGTKLGEKLNAAFEFLEENRRKAASTDLFDYLNTFISTSGFEAYVLSKPDGADRLAALRKFVYGLKGQTYAKSPHAFVGYWDSREEEASSDSAFSDDGKCIVMQSMHGSKGLEYPIVFVANLSTSYVNDQKGAVGIDEKLGLAVQVFDEETRTISPSLLSRAVELSKQEKQRSEEMRLLYVALTRAKYRLYVSGSCSQKQEARYKSIYKANSMLDVLFYAAYLDESLSADIDFRLTEPVIKNAETQPVVPFGKPDTIYNKIIDEIINHKYKYEAQTRAEQKYSVTALNAEETDETASTTSLFDDGDRRTVGIAYHSVMENVDFNLASEAEVRQAIDKMAEEGILSAADAAEVKEDEIFACIQNAELRKILGLDEKCETTPQIYTELPFTLLVPADKVLENPGYGDKVLVQGVIDLLVMGDEIVIVDYKNSLKSPEKLAETYKKQLYLYKMAVETSFGEKVDKIALYSFPKKALYYL